MPNEDQDKTKVYNFDELNNTNEEPNEENQIFEMEVPKETNTSIENLDSRPDMDFFMKPPEEEKKKKKPNKIKEWWKKRSKKQKILLVSVLIIFLIALGIGIFFLVKSLKKEEVIEPPVDVIVEEENYLFENVNLIFLNANK